MIGYTTVQLRGNTSTVLRSSDTWRKSRFPFLSVTVSVTVAEASINSLLLPLMIRNMNAVPPRYGAMIAFLLKIIFVAGFERRAKISPAPTAKPSIPVTASSAIMLFAKIVVGWMAFDPSVVMIWIL